MLLKWKTFHALALISLLICSASALPGYTTATQKKDEAEKPKKDKNKGAADSGASQGRPVLWEEPTDIESRDLFNGIGGAAGAPDPNGKFTFVKRSPGGTSEKIQVDDDKGRKWTVKFGPEAGPETSATRIVWAAGYHVDQDYFVKRTHIEGRGGFNIWDVRFERRDDGFKEEDLWPWQANPFNGTRELQGLKVLMALLNNWDLKTDNNKMVVPDKKSGGNRDIRLYYVADLGGTLGKTGNFIRSLPFLGEAPGGTKGDPDHYSSQPFIEGVQNGHVVFFYKGKDRKTLEGITVENARWMGNLLGRLSDKQLSDAFRAGGFSDAEVAIYVKAMRDRINQLKNLR